MSFIWWIFRTFGKIIFRHTHPEMDVIDDAVTILRVILDYVGVDADDLVS